MKKFKLSSIDAPPELSTLLFTAWVQLLAEQRLGLQNHSGGIAADGSANYNFGDPTKANFTLERSPKGEWSLKSLQGIAEQELETIIADARQKHDSRNFGGDVVYQTTMRAQAFDMSPVMMSQFMRILGDQVPISGRRRLGSRVLLELRPSQQKTQQCRNSLCHQ
jgi:hypothetical protein